MLFIKSIIIFAIMKRQIAGQKPLVYRNPLCHLVDSLPYYEEQPTVHKSQIIHLIRLEQQLIQDSLESYIQDLELPKTPFLDSKQLEIDEIRKAHRELEIKELPIEEISAKQTQQEIKRVVESTQIKIKKDILKGIDLELIKKFGPVAFREQLAAIAEAKQRLNRLIEDKAKSISDLNKQRKYEQLEGGERIQTEKDRVKCLIDRQITAAVRDPGPEKRLKDA